MMTNNHQRDSGQNTPKPQMSIMNSKPPVTKQWVETDQMTGMAAQWSHSTPAVSLIAGQHMQQVWQCQHGTGCVSIQGIGPAQVNINGRFSQSASCCTSGINIVNGLDIYFSRQVLMQMAMNPILDFDGTNLEATIPWLDHIEGVAEKMGFDPVEIDMSKLKGMALCQVNAASKEGTISYFQFCQLLIEHYSNILCMSDTLNAYAHLAQGEHESIAQYLTRVEVLLWHIHHNCKMYDIPGISYDKFYLVRGLHSLHTQ